MIFHRQPNNSVLKNRGGKIKANVYHIFLLPDKINASLFDDQMDEPILTHSKNVVHGFLINLPNPTNIYFSKSIQSIKIYLYHMSDKGYIIKDGFPIVRNIINADGSRLNTIQIPAF